MRKKILSLVIVLLLFNSLVLALIFERENDNLKQLRREIHLLNLVNGLGLKPDQKEILKEKILERIRIEESVREKLQRKEEELFSSLNEIRDYLSQEKEIPEQLRQKYHKISFEIKREFISADKKIENLALEIENILKEHQKYQLSKFIPCIIPPKGELRIGQANDYSGITRLMERIRKIPERAYQWNKRLIISRTIEKFKITLFPRDEIDENKMRNYLSKFFDRVRNLPDADFEVQKDKLAKEFFDTLAPERRKQDLVDKIKLFLLTPEIIPILDRN